MDNQFIASGNRRFHLVAGLLVIALVFPLSMQLLGSKSEKPLTKDTQEPKKEVLAGTYCRTNTDCPSGESCVKNTCMTSSETVPAASPTPTTSTYCRSDVDCPRGQTCSNNFCSTPVITYSLSGLIFLDTNKNGVFDRGESGFSPPVQVTYTGVGNGTAVSGNGGNFKFVVTSGTYKLFIPTLPTGYITTTANPIMVSVSSDTTVYMGVYGDTTPTPTTRPNCIQVITYARNNITKVCQEFPTPCDVPSGWTVDSTCEPVTATPTPTVITPTPTPNCLIMNWFCTVTPTHTPTPTVSDECALNPQGDANCDRSIDLVDFNLWRESFLRGGRQISPTDFNDDEAVDLLDFNIWRNTFINGTVIPSKPTMKTPPCTQYGDVTRDGFVSKEDSDLILKFVAGLAQPTSEQQLYADVDGDKTISSTDALFVQRYVEGLDSSFKACLIPTSPVSLRKPPCENYGDVNQDGYVTKDDADLILRIVAGLENYTAEQRIRADVDGNRTITSTDALFVQRYIEGYDSTFKVCGGYTTPTPIPVNSGR